MSDASGDTVSQATTGTNQYMFYTKKAGDSSGTWKAQFVSTETYKWQLYYAHYYNANARSSVPRGKMDFTLGIITEFINSLLQNLTDLILFLQRLLI